MSTVRQICDNINARVQAQGKQWYQRRVREGFAMLALRPLSSVSRSSVARRFCSVKIPTSVYVANITYTTQKEDVQSHFSPYGEILNVHMVMNKETGKPKGVAFVNFASAEQAAFAVESLNDTEFRGRVLIVRPAKPFVPNSPRTSPSEPSNTPPTTPDQSSTPTKPLSASDILPWL
eukprot:TRINITY_DN415_c0_g1_i11.p1 TRINITY_DN415_c0_g1~~TRINITY_DN415_c0_g1_i11.p1  ORF type:complete len:190 (-),score=28.60 TRINITY_DN415_c0_g1_i11:163-693(-)